MGFLDLLTKFLNFPSYNTLKGIRISLKVKVFYSFICEFQWNSTFYQVGRVFGTGYTSKRTKVKLYKNNYIHCTRLHTFCIVFDDCAGPLDSSFGNYRLLSFIVLDPSILSFRSRNCSEIHKPIIIVLVNPDFLHFSQISGGFWPSDIYWLQATRHSWTAGYQASRDSRLPDIYGL